MALFIDRVHRLPRVWSNRELEKHAHLFTGRVVNVSAWQDADKEGRRYSEYFTNATSYTITNYKAEARGFQGLDGEIFLDLEQSLPEGLHRAFDLVFNHTTLEHVYDIRGAFGNLCEMSRDGVIIVLPFLQQYHSDYGDYWRLSPLAIKRMFEDNGFEVIYQSFNSDRMSSVYVYTIASRTPERWRGHFDWSFSCADPLGRGPEPFIGNRAIPNLSYGLPRLLRRLSALPLKVLRRAKPGL